MAGPKPKGPTRGEPEWVQEAHTRGLTIEEIAGVFVVTKTNDQPLWEGGETPEHDNGASDSGKQVAVGRPANGE